MDEVKQFDPNQLYDDLLKLCEPEDSPFYCVDHKIDETIYRVFTYRLAQYTDFLKPNALECRSSMFVVKEDGTFIRLASLGMEKYFNVNENPMTMNLDLTQEAELVMDKVDGSLISSYIHYPAKLHLKSKTSLTSEQAKAAEKCLHVNIPLYNFVKVMTKNDWTVNLELQHPEFRIVVSVQEPRLTVLNLRNNKTGEYMKYSAVQELMKHWKCEEYLVKNHIVNGLEEFIKSVPDMKDGGEGFVIRFKDGLQVKIKKNAYIALHRMKDSLGSQKRLFEVVVNEAHDDAKAAFADDPFVISQIEDMEKKVAAIWVTLKKNVIDFYNANKELSRKDFAILGQEKLDRMYFGLAMTLYLGKEPSYCEWMLKHYKELGIRDEPVDNDE